MQIRIKIVLDNNLRYAILRLLSCLHSEIASAHENESAVPIV